MRSFNLRSTVAIIIVFVVVIMLVACGNGLKETEMKDLIFIEKTMDYTEPSIIFESLEDKKYYLVEIDNYSYDNLELKPEDTLSLESRNVGNIGNLKKILFIEVFGDTFDLPQEEIFILDEWRPLFIMTQYIRDIKEAENEN